MTDHRAHDDRDQAVDHWLNQHQHTLIDALDDVLDTEAGLREILIHSHHDSAVDGLDTVLDTEAGLTAILPPTPQPTDPPTPHGIPHAHTSGQELLHTLGPADRMSLRNHPDVKQASRARARALNLAARARVLDPDLELERDLDFARDLAHDLNRDLGRAIAHDLNRACARNRGLDRYLAFERLSELTAALNGAIARARILDPALDRARELTAALDHARAHVRHFDLDLDLDLALDRARELTAALDLVRNFDLARDLTPSRDLARDLDRIVIDVRTAEVRRAIGLALRREPPELDEDSLHTLLDDFTTADLSNAVLTSRDLSGVHWSEHGTQWPPTLDVEKLKARSDETPPRSGTWIVRSGTSTIRNLAEL
ncbi:hypothetical protein [Streptomyces sp. NRRL B-3648]|uniref:hypothetical protein n=1 Tax=Streptomyces sp. NRRL B-3648 TaxID=1519493 RepID=UPI0006AE642C|nr:hypothetical protein [Streptomyces sp. NRRL B-3648]KOV93758.1 hypothetical protein ADL04_26695 [Streptomyces sp. NRRL B-3648]